MCEHYFIYLEDGMKNNMTETKPGLMNYIKWKKSKEIVRKRGSSSVEDDPGSLCTKRGPCIQPSWQKKREALEVSHPGFSTFLDPCTYVGMSTCLWHMQNDLPHTTGPAMTAVTEYTPRLNIREEMLLYLFCMSGS